MRKLESLVIKAGPSAYKEIKDHGFDLTKIKTIMGASGGPKWLVLSHLDRLILDKIVPILEGPVQLISSSISSWRFICYAQKDPIQAINNFEDGYINQYFPSEYTKKKFSNQLRKMFDHICPPSAIKDVINHAVFETNIVTAQSHHILKTENNPVLLFGLLLTFLANLTNRKNLDYFFSRVLFSSSNNKIIIDKENKLKTKYIELTEGNIKDVVVASSSIPIYLEGVKKILGSPKEVYRDGGIVDYHFDYSPVEKGGFVLYPHFFDLITPGWFDRSIASRHSNPMNHQRTIMICPSHKFINELPLSKVPDRSDFTKLSNQQRMKNWKKVVSSCERLADEFNQILEKNQIESFIKPI